MKVLSIKEPFASLISKNIKHIETRSWKTNYRGELYIHASLTKNDTSKRKELLELTKDIDLKPGYILCKCDLIDCIYMDEDFVKNIKNNKIESICGRYEIGRYAWILDNIQIIKPILAKGKLGIWNYSSEENYNKN